MGVQPRAGTVYLPERSSLLVHELSPRKTTISAAPGLLHGGRDRDSYEAVLVSIRERSADLGALD